MKKLLPFVIIFAVITVIFGSMYVIGQQTIRLSANMPQIQMAEDAAHALDGGTMPNAVLPSGNKVDIGSSSAGFVIVYNASGKAVASSAVMDGQTPVVPFGVLQHTPTLGYNAVSWEPGPDVRIASVTVRAKDYYVLAGRLLTEPEKLITTIGKLTLFGYVITLLIALGGYLALWNPKKSKK